MAVGRFARQAQDRRGRLELTIEDDKVAWARKRDEIAQEAALDGLYAVRTSLPEEILDDDAAVKAYESLARVEQT